MKKIILLVLAGVASWQIYSSQNVPTITNHDIEAMSIANRAQTVNTTRFEEQFACDGRQHCSQMTSCEEATYFIKNCPNTKMDGDHDGVPCEKQHCSW